MAREQKYVSMLYGRLDGLRERASGRLADALRQAGGTHQARTEREAFVVLYTRQIAQFDAAEQGLCFGRLEFSDGELRYIGRLGIHGDTDDYEQLLMDWRADAARPFYLATAAAPDEVKVRRHLKTRSRQIVSLDDEELDLSVADPSRPDGLTRQRRLPAPPPVTPRGLAGESSLLAALNASRTGRMSDIVETIQAEQDVIIRSSLAGVLVVQGGPGTGKTAVALHRAAYLLYIGQVLPSLGETSVLLSTIGELLPGVSATGTEPARTAEIKGRLRFAQIIANASRDQQHVPDNGLEVVVDREPLRLGRRALAQARERARRSRRPHNSGPQGFARELITALTRQAAERLGANVLGGGNLLGAEDLDDLRRELSADPAVRAAIDQLWPVLTAEQLLAGLFGAADRLAAAAGLTEAERAGLLREPGAPWTPPDVPLLDEAAELLGDDDRAARQKRERERLAREAYAQGVLDIMSRDIEDDPEILMGADLVDASRLASRQDDDLGLTAAERAAADRTWAFGHVIIDEAQELSPMAWRMLMRRCPAKSMTIVGDVAQTGDLGGSASWEQSLAPYLGDRWRLAPLTINYRTPAEIMTVAADVLPAIDPSLELPRSVRESGSAPWRLAVTQGEYPAAVADAAQRLAAQTGDGKLAVIVPAGRLGKLGSAVSAAIPAAAVGENPDLESPVVVLSVKQAKGLEFDAVLIAEPAEIVAESPRGLSELYVALTR